MPIQERGPKLFYKNPDDVPAPKKDVPASDEAVLNLLRRPNEFTVNRDAQIVQKDTAGGYVAAENQPELPSTSGEAISSVASSPNEQTQVDGLSPTEARRIIQEAQQPVTMEVSTLPPSSAQPERNVVAKPVQLSPLERAKALEAEQLARGERGDKVIQPEVPQSQPAEQGRANKTEERVMAAVFREMKTYEQQVNNGNRSPELTRKILASRETLQRFISTMSLQQENVPAYRGMLQKLEDLLKIVNKH